MIFCPSSATGGPFEPIYHAYEPERPSTAVGGGSGGETAGGGGGGTAGGGGASGPGSGTGGGTGGGGGRRQLQGPSRTGRPSADDLAGADGRLSDAGLDLLRLPFCKVTLRDDTEFDCELREVEVGPPRKRMKCIEVQSSYIGSCSEGEETCDGDASFAWVSVEVRFMFELARAPPIFAKEFKAFFYGKKEEIRAMNDGTAMTFGVPFDSYRCASLHLSRHALRLSRRD
jgi:hypothetical protein